MNNLPVGAELDPRAPWNSEPEKSCGYCGEPSEKDFCSRSCYIANLRD